MAEIKNKSFKLQYGSEKMHNKILDSRLPNIVGLIKNTPYESIGKRLVRHDDAKYRFQYATHTSNPDHLHQLADDESTEVRATVARNPDTKIETLDKLVRDPDRSVRRAICANPNLQAHHGVHFAAHHSDDSWLVRAAAKFPETHDILINHPEESVRSAVAMHVKTEEHAKKLLHDTPEVRDSLAHNKAMAHVTHPVLMHDEHPMVRMNVAKRASKEIAQQMHENDPDSGVRHYAYVRAKELGHPIQYKYRYESAGTLNSFMQFNQNSNTEQD